MALFSFSTLDSLLESLPLVILGHSPGHYEQIQYCAVILRLAKKVWDYFKLPITYLLQGILWLCQKYILSHSKTTCSSSAIWERLDV